MSEANAFCGSVLIKVVLSSKKTICIRSFTICYSYDLKKCEISQEVPKTMTTVSKRNPESMTEGRPDFSRNTI
jgi:hypothetical protein